VLSHAVLSVGLISDSVAIGPSLSVGLISDSVAIGPALSVSLISDCRERTFS
jgi:hypothetical protein